MGVEHNHRSNTLGVTEGVDDQVAPTLKFGDWQRYVVGKIN